MSRTSSKGLKRVAPIAEEAGITIVLELLNSAVNHHDYYIDNSEDMAAVLWAVNSPNVKGLYDIYHAGIMEGNVTEKILTNLDIIGHFHAAGIPGRHEIRRTKLPVSAGKLTRRDMTIPRTRIHPLKPSKTSMKPRMAEK